MIPVEQALARITTALTPVANERVSLIEAAGRVLATAPVAGLDHPAADISAMDGYAVRHEDIDNTTATLPPLQCIGEVPAGVHNPNAIACGQCMRIFTGGVIPTGADTVIIQENTRAQGDQITHQGEAVRGQFIRRAAMDFATGDTPLRAGRRLTARDIALAAAMDCPQLRVFARPRVSILATGNELRQAGTAHKAPHKIPSANGPGLAAFIHQAGGIPRLLDIVPDTQTATQQALDQATREADLVVTSGGASKGDYDYLHTCLAPTEFWGVAMRPGKPSMFAYYKDVPVIALPGNPVSVLVTAQVLLAPALAKLAGEDAPPAEPLIARAGSALAEGGQRQTYLRATLAWEKGQPIATPVANQDSAALADLAKADALIIRPIDAPALATGTKVPILPLWGSSCFNFIHT